MGSQVPGHPASLPPWLTSSPVTAQHWPSLVFQPLPRTTDSISSLAYGGVNEPTLWFRLRAAGWTPMPTCGFQGNFHLLAQEGWLPGPQRLRLGLSQAPPPPPPSSPLPPFVCRKSQGLPRPPGSSPLLPGALETGLSVGWPARWPTAMLAPRAARHTVLSLETRGPRRGLSHLDLTVRAGELGGVRGPGEGRNG